MRLQSSICRISEGDFQWEIYKKRESIYSIFICYLPFQRSLPLALRNMILETRIFIDNKKNRQYNDNMIITEFLREVSNRLRKLKF